MKRDMLSPRYTSRQSDQQRVGDNYNLGAFLGQKQEMGQVLGQKKGR